MLCALVQIRNRRYSHPCQRLQSGIASRLRKYERDDRTPVEVVVMGHGVDSTSSKHCELSRRASVEPSTLVGTRCLGERDVHEKVRLDF